VVHSTESVTHIGSLSVFEPGMKEREREGGGGGGGGWGTYWRGGNATKLVVNLIDLGVGSCSI
jgi:hypothetical protein